MTYDRNSSNCAISLSASRAASIVVITAKINVQRQKSLKRNGCLTPRRRQLTPEGETSTERGRNGARDASHCERYVTVAERRRKAGRIHPINNYIDGIETELSRFII